MKWEPAEQASLRNAFWMNGWAVQPVLRRYRRRISSYPDDSYRSEILDLCILPFAREHKLPFALMIGKWEVNPC